MYQLRTYTLQTTDALERYATVHWPRHISSLRAFGVTTHGIWTQHERRTIVAVAVARELAGFCWALANTD
jgi:hypothetical protein